MMKADFLIENVLKTHSSCMRNGPFPQHIIPMEPVVYPEPFDSGDWLFERKRQGLRCGLTIKDSYPTLHCPYHPDLSHQFPELIETLTHKGYDNLVADGILVGFRGIYNGKKDLVKLTDRLNVTARKKEGVQVFLYLFDFTYFMGYSLRTLPLYIRKRLLKDYFIWDHYIKFCNHRNVYGVEFYLDGCKAGWAGIIAKKKNSPYLEGQSDLWRIIKCATS